MTRLAMPRLPRDPFARKMFYGSLVYGGVLLVMFAVLTVIYLHTRPRCSDRLAAESTSPGRQWTAALMERRCGEESPFFSHVNLRRAGTELQHGFFSGVSSEGEVFLIEQDAAGADIHLQWTTPDTLTIQCPRCNPSLLRKQDRQWNGVAVKYESPSR